MTPAITPDFSTQPAVLSSELALSLIPLDHLDLLNIVGPDAIKYLQGQVTCDVPTIQPEHYSLGAHCDAKGKMWSVFTLFHLNDGFGWIQPKSLTEQQLPELKKYAVFSKLTITENTQWKLAGLAGSHAATALQTLTDTLPDAATPVVNAPFGQIMYLPTPADRYLLVIDTHTTPQESLYSTLQQSGAILRHHTQWQALDIEAGLPQLSTQTMAEFIPQAVNLQALNAISFTKGCYAGQEMVARAKYRGANKRALYTLLGRAARLPVAGESVELKLGDNWRKTGTVLSAAALPAGKVLIQIVLSSDLEPDAQLRVIDEPSSQLAIYPLPYQRDLA